MVEETIIRNWSEALFLLVADTKTIEKSREEAEVLIDIFATNQAFIDLVKSNNLLAGDRLKIINQTFAGLSTYMTNFLLLLAEKHYFQYVRPILKAFRRHCNAYFGIEYGTVYSVITLSSEQMKAIQEKIAYITKCKDVELVNKIDKTLIGGVVVKLKNKVFDGSIKGRIGNLRAKLLNNK